MDLKFVDAWESAYYPDRLVPVWITWMGLGNFT